MKRWKECEDGFTMVEMIITIAISAILVGTAVATFGYINSGNAKRSAARFNSKLNTAQTETMMLEKPTYLYLYKVSDGSVKCILLKDNCQTRNDLNSKLTGLTPTDVGGSGVSVRAKIEGGGTYTLGDNNMIKVAFDKASGAYKTANFGDDTNSDFYNEIEFSGRQKFKVSLVKMTGKHVMSQ